MQIPLLRQGLGEQGFADNCKLGTFVEFTQFP